MSNDRGQLDVGEKVVDKARKVSDLLGHTFAPSRSTSLDLTNTKSDDEIGNDSVLSLA